MERVGGKTQKTASCKEKQTPRKSAACLNSLDEKEKKSGKESADALDPEEYPVPCTDGSPMSHLLLPPPRHGPTPAPAKPHQRKQKVAIWADTSPQSGRSKRSSI